MTTWRETTSETAQDDLDGLLDTVLPYAEQTLSKDGELLPFSASVDGAGEVEVVAADPGIDEPPASTDVLDALLDAARDAATTRRAFAFVADVLLLDDQDALRVELEHREGVALQVLVPYRRSRFRKAVTFGEMSLDLVEPRVWADPSAAGGATDDR